ncbi:MAG: hypothetical protein LH606_01580 [Cytophagaceae bacterium]|nr:hypothetical protein [Cytophagaceae bacterium]
MSDDRRRELEEDLFALYKILDFYVKRGNELSMTPSGVDAYIDVILDEINQMKRELNDESGNQETPDS